MAVTHKLKLDISKSTPILPRRVVVRQGEADTQTIEADILKDGAAYTSPLPSARLDIMRFGRNMGAHRRRGIRLQSRLHIACEGDSRTRVVPNGPLRVLLGDG